jgi:TonB family protein
MRVFVLLFLSATFVCSQQLEPEHLIRVSWGVAQTNVISHPPVQCPPIAKAARVRGVVYIEIQVDREGKVRSRKVKSGHPMLTQAALDNIQEWNFRPMLLKGKPIVMETTAEIAPCDVPDAAYEKEAKFRDQQIKVATDCRARVQAADTANAEEPCKKALDMAHKVKGNTYLYESNALNNLGILRLEQKKPQEALSHFEESLKLLEANQEPDEAELGYTVSWVGIARRHMGDDAGALPYLERAEKILSARIAGTDFEEMRKNYARQLKSVREQHIGALDNLGRKDEADALRKLASQ